VPDVVIGEPATETIPPVNDWATLVTVPEPDTVAQDVVEPLVVRYLPELPVWVGASASNAAVVVVAPVPPFATGKAVPEYVSASVPDAVIGLPLTVKNAGAERATLVTVPVPPTAVQVVFVPSLDRTLPL
jgi:hypothetical protein